MRVSKLPRLKRLEMPLVALLHVSPPGYIIFNERFLCCKKLTTVVRLRSVARLGSMHVTKRILCASMCLSRVPFTKKRGPYQSEPRRVRRLLELLRIALKLDSFSCTSLDQLVEFRFAGFNQCLVNSFQDVTHDLGKSLTRQ